MEILTASLAIVCLSFTVYLFRELRRFTTKIVVLIFEGILNILLFVLSLDICNSRGLLSYQATTLLSQTSYSIIGITNLLMAFFFFELFSDQLISARESFIPQYKIHFLVISGVVLLIRIILSILTCIYLLSETLLYSIGGFLLLISSFLAIVVLIAVLLKCYSDTNADDSYLKIVRVVVFRFVLVCVILSILALTPGFIIMNSAYYTTYSARVVINFFIIVTWTLSFFKIYKIVFVPTVRAINSSREQSKKTKIKDNRSIEIATDKPLSEVVLSDTEMENF